jgi:hypothetical protein
MKQTHAGRQREEGEKRRPPIRWLDSAEQDLRVLGIQGRINKAQDRSQWKDIVGEVKACNRL